MRIVGLTGGISSGKSTVSNLFKSNGVPVVDADVVARDVLIKGRGGWKKVVDAFGEDILLPNGEVDRPKLGAIVFSDPAKRQLLNRRPSDAPVRRLEEWRSNQIVRGRGRPKKTWMRVIESDMGLLGVEESMMLDKSGWRDSIHVKERA